MSAPSPPLDPGTAVRIETAVSPERLANYRRACHGDLGAAVALYEWNAELSGALWQTLGHVEVLLRNALAGRMQARHHRLARPGSWLDDPDVGLDQRGRDDIATARRRVHTKGKPIGDGQIVSELSFGFWRFLLARRYQTTLWPTLASGFPHAPSRNRHLVEDPVVRLHEFRNRLAHQQRVWSEPVEDRYADCLLITGYIDPLVTEWIAATSPVPAVLTSRP